MSDINGALSNVLDLGQDENKDQQIQELPEYFIKEPYFYDMEFDSSKRTLLLNAWPIRSDRFWETVDPESSVLPADKKPDSEYVKKNYANIKRLECSQVIICDID